MLTAQSYCDDIGSSVGAVPTGLADTAIWSHLWERKTVGDKKVESGLLKGEDSDLISRWRRAAFGIANGKTPEAGQSLKDFAVTCNDDVPRTGNAGGTGKRDVTDASRAKGLRAAEEAVIALGSRLAKWSPSKETTKALTALQEALSKDATAAEAAVAAKKTAAK